MLQLSGTRIRAQQNHYDSERGWNLSGAYADGMDTKRQIVLV